MGEKLVDGGYVLPVEAKHGRDRRKNLRIVDRVVLVDQPVAQA
jgi:hypothetical protein